MPGGRRAHLPRGLRALLCLWKAVLVVGTGSKAWDVPASPLSSPSNLSESMQWEPPCRHHALLGGERTTADLPPRLEGTWVSSRCEVRPGPEFLTRSYTFHASRQFSALQHYYSDGGCERPTYSLSVRGKLRLRQASWITRGATEAEHHLSRVALAVHDPAAVRKLAERLAPACAGPLGQAAPGAARDLYNTRAGRSCLVAMGFSMTEMGLVRVETRQHQDVHGARRVQELFLGDIHTEWVQRTHHRPSGYQQPLQNAVHHVHPCMVCGLVYRSTLQRPPVLRRAPPAALALEGRWVSERCEARPSVLFLTRDFTFRPDRHAWEGVYHHYSDPGCSRATFSLRASGHYALGGPSARLQGAFELAFKVTRVLVTPWDEASVGLLNGTRPGHCGPPGRWEPGAERDVSATAGCSALGIKLPHKEYELVRTELDPWKHPLLFTGERPTDGSSPDRPLRRPTSFQPPMVLCGGGKAAPTHGTGGPGFISQQVQPAAGGSERLAGLGLLALGAAGCSWLWVM